MPDNILFLLFASAFVWLGALTFFFIRLLTHYNSLSKGVSQKSLKSILEDLLKDVDLNKKDIEYLKSYASKIDKQGSLHVQKIGLLRFNPFKDTGGDQSFILSLIDGNNSGVIISALYSRSGTRWYAKKVIEGQGSEYELSDEEKQVLKDAVTLN
ncbi:MAG: hypothetical protein A2798_01660 [Candidatus Levybacteria bacterium RIFCSPHIGHO2_01_FULL_37_17]|nr:MAG: hypothetical protein A2798_01660 [Candidatus Levybacteria bacterium RIFCSPHIGHO2_01_FULL_37_17]OGH37155.1 MAG: hypothetical protein A2959_02520 [Candidatus Levybacteria bacterium RIFCSPLOWO2_01_FULL_38_23]